MELINKSGFQVSSMMGYGPDDSPVLVVIIKGTFKIGAGEIASPDAVQLPILTVDENYDAVDIASVRCEADLVPFKPRTDVVVVGRAYAPGGVPVTSLTAAVQVGRFLKQIRIVGDRHWRVPLLSILEPHISDPEPFLVMDLVYDRAFGGIDHLGGEWCRENPVGRGFFAKKNRDALDDSLLPNLENPDDPDYPITSWKDRPMPIGLGFYGQTWLPRVDFLGTIDEAWALNRAPRMPSDFSFEYYNGAHPDLQLEYRLVGNENVELTNLSPEGQVRFFLPGLKPVVTVTQYIELPQFLREPLEDQENEPALGDLSANGSPGTEPQSAAVDLQAEGSEPPSLPCPPPQVNQAVVNCELDTVCFLPDEARFYLVWRAQYPVQDLERASLEIATIRVETQELDATPSPLETALQPQTVEPVLDDLQKNVIDLGLLESSQRIPKTMMQMIVTAIEQKRRDANNTAPTNLVTAKPQEELSPIEPPAADWITQPYAYSPVVKAHDVEQTAERAESELDETTLIEIPAPLEAPTEQSVTTEESPLKQQPPTVSNELGLTIEPEILSRSATQDLSLDAALRKIGELYKRRLNSLYSPRYGWTELEEAEQQLRTYAESLKVTSGRQIRQLAMGLRSENLLEAFAAAYTLLVRARKRGFKAIVDAASHIEIGTVRNLVDACRLAGLEALEQSIKPYLLATDPEQQVLLLELIGDRRLAGRDIRDFVGKSLIAAHPAVVRAAVKAQWRLRFPEFMPLIRRFAFQAEPVVQDMALLTLLLDGKPEAYRALTKLCAAPRSIGTSRYVYLAYSGNKATLPVLTASTRHPMAIFGLGILGYVEAVPILLNIIANQSESQVLAAAEALEIITGARSAKSEGSTVLQGNTEQESATLEPHWVRTTAPEQRDKQWLSAEIWDNWWLKNGHRCSKEIRWRLGESFSPEVCFKQMADCHRGYSERMWAYHELVINTRTDFPFEADWSVHEQQVSLMQWREWLNQNRRS